MAGLAVVRTIDRAGLEELAEILGDGAHGVTPGAMKLYPPSLDPASGPDERHVEVAPERVARPGLSAAFAVRSLERQAVCRRAPRSRDQARRRLEDSAPGSELIVYIQARSADRVRELERDLETERSDSEYYLEEATELEEQVSALQAELADARARIHALRHDLAEPADPEVDPGLLVRDCSSAVALARDQLSEFLTVLDSAIRGLPDLDAQSEAGSWGRKAWRAFRALAAYAQQRRVGVGGDFRQWCATTGHPDKIAANALAMGESTTTVSRWGDQRVFDVDGEPVTMLAHIRVGGRRVAPRIHFDRDDATERVRVGYFGRHLRNTRT